MSKILFVTFALGISLIEFYGCTGFGYFIGKRMDEGLPGFTNGDQIQVVYINGNTSTNTFQGIQTRDSHSYAQLYLEAQKQLSLANFTLPNLGDTIELVSYVGIKRQRTHMVFMGFDRDSVVGLTLSVSGLNKVFYRRALTEFETLSQTKDISYTTNAILDQLHSGRVPFCSILLVQDSVAISMEQIREIKKLTPQRARWIGLGVGVVSDVIVFLYLRYQFLHNPLYWK